MAVLQEATMTTSIIMNMFNNSKEMSTRILEAIRKGTVMDQKSIDLQILQIKRTKLSPLADKVMTAFLDGDIVLLYNKTVKIPPGVPFVTVKKKTGIISYVFLNSFATLDADPATGMPIVNIPMKDLYALMESAYISSKYHEYPTLLQRNLALMKTCSLIYTNMMLRILNKDFGLSTDRDTYDMVSFCIAKFFLENVWEAKNEDVITRYSKANILTPNNTELSVLEEEYNTFLGKDVRITSFADLLKFLNHRFPRLRTLHIRFFMQSYINYYKANAIFGIDVLPYFLFIVVSAMLGSFIINQPILQDIMKNTNTIKPATFYQELSKIF